MLGTYTIDSDVLIDICLSPNGQIVAICSSDRKISLFNVKTGEKIHSLSFEEEEYFHAAFSPNGQTLASASFCGLIRLWDVQTGKTIQTLSGHISDAESIVFSSNGKQILSCSGSRAILWDVETGNKIARLRDNFIEDSCHIRTSPDLKTVVVRSNDSLFCREMETGKEMWHFSCLVNNESPFNVETSSNSSLVAFRSISDENIIVKCRKTEKRIATLSGHKNFVFDFKFSVDDKMIVSTSMDKTTRVWDVKTGQQKRKFANLVECIESTWSPLDQYIASFVSPNGFQVWSVVDSVEFYASAISLCQCLPPYVLLQIINFQLAIKHENSIEQEQEFCHNTKIEFVLRLIKKCQNKV